MMRGTKRSRIPVSTSVPSSLYVKAVSPRDPPEPTVTSNSTPPDSQETIQHQSMIKKVERQIQRFLIQDIKIVIPSGTNFSALITHKIFCADQIALKLL